MYFHSILSPIQRTHAHTQEVYPSFIRSHLRCWPIIVSGNKITFGRCRSEDGIDGIFLTYFYRPMVGSFLTLKWLSLTKPETFSWSREITDFHWRDLKRSGVLLAKKDTRYCV